MMSKLTSESSRKSPLNEMPSVRLDSLTETLLEQILAYLSFSESHRLVFCLNRRLWREQRLLLAETTKHLVLDTVPMPTLPSSSSPSSTSFITVFPMYCNLQELDLQSHCNDYFLKCMAEHQFFPHLKRIQMRRSWAVTDQGLEYLSRHCAHPVLQEIDITYCRDTSYAGTFVLRDRLAHCLQLLRRQPEWLDGQFHTPFGGGGDSNNPDQDAVEVHTYWPDGTFTFNRDSQSNGFVIDLLEWEEDKYLGDKLQYNNFDTPFGWPLWTRYAYRPGVCLLRLDDNDDDDNVKKDMCCESMERQAATSASPQSTSNNVRSVLVGQKLKGLRPPQQFSLMKDIAPHISPGESKYIDLANQQIYNEPDDERERLLISKMDVYPLDTKMPPKELVEECRRTCEAIERWTDDFLMMREVELDRILSSDNAR